MRVVDCVEGGEARTCCEGEAAVRAARERRGQRTWTFAGNMGVLVKGDGKGVYEGW